MAATQRGAQPDLDLDQPADATERPTLRVHCFGTLRVSYGGVAVDGFESQKVRGLFAYLACHRGQPLSRDHLAAVFWPGKDEEGARRNLRQSLYNLRSLFPRGRPAVLASRQALELDSERVGRLRERLPDAIYSSRESTLSLRAPGPDEPEDERIARLGSLADAISSSREPVAEAA